MAVEKILLIVGLPSSGRGIFAKEVAELNGMGTIIYDPKDINDAVGLTEDFVLTDSAFCDANVMYDAILFLMENYDSVSIDRVYFSNEPNVCKANAMKSAYKEENAMIDELSSVYDIEKGFHVMSCYVF